jgi:hypothetical protein
VHGALGGVDLAERVGLGKGREEILAVGCDIAVIGTTDGVGALEVMLVAGDDQVNAVSIKQGQPNQPVAGGSSVIECLLVSASRGRQPRSAE